MNATEIDGPTAHRARTSSLDDSATGPLLDGLDRNESDGHCAGPAASPAGFEHGGAADFKVSSGRWAAAAPVARAALSGAGRPKRSWLPAQIRFSRLLWVSLFVGAAGLALVAARHASSGAPEEDQDALTALVERVNLVVTVTEDGQVESATNTNVKCDVPGPIRILELVDDGTQVGKGDVLAKLDSSEIEDEILKQKIVTTKAQATKVKAEKDLAAAAIAVDEYLEGTYVQDLRKLEIDVTVAKQGLTAAENAFAFATKMQRKGYATMREVKVKEYALEQAKRDVGLAELKKQVLEKYTRPKTLEELSSARDSAQAQVDSETAALQQERVKLKRLEDQLEKCMLLAPEAGMAIYANDRQNWADTSPKVELGARVNQFQAIFRLPDLKNMQVRTLVHENKVDALRPGLSATIKIQDREFEGEIASIANQPEPSGLWQGFVKEYVVIVRIVGEPHELKPGKTAEVRILVDQRQNVLTIPVQCVVQRGTTYYAFVKTPGGIQRRELLLGAKNDTSVEIVDGLKEGERVLLTPRAEALVENDE